MYSKIYNPKTYKYVNISGKIGKQILNNYINFVKQMGGSTVTNSDEFNSASIMDLKLLLDTIELSEDVQLKELYSEFQKKYENPSFIINKFISDSNLKWSVGKFYLGGQLELDINEKISIKTIEEVDDMIRQRFIDYGITNSSEMIQVQNNIASVKLIKNLLNFYKRASIYLKSKND